MKKGMKIFWVVAHLVFGAYFINVALQFLIIPQNFGAFNKWIIFVGGILVLLGGINYWRITKKSA